MNQEAPTMGTNTDLAPVIPSISENPMLDEVIFNWALEVENRTEEYVSRLHLPFNEYGYIPMTSVDPRFLPSRLVPPDIGQRNPWSISTQLSTNRQLVTPDVIHRPSPILPHPHPSPVITVNPHPFAKGNQVPGMGMANPVHQFAHIPPPSTIHGGPPHYQVPGVGLANQVHQYLYNQPFPYFSMPPVQMRPSNLIRSLPTLTHIPILSGRLDFAPWDSGICSIL